MREAFHTPPHEDRFGSTLMADKGLYPITMAGISISIENNYFWGDNNITATFNILSCIN